MTFVSYFSVLEPPLHGQLLVAANRTRTLQFTQLDIDEDRLTYQHDGSNSMNDSIRFTAEAGSVSASGVVRF